MLMAAILLVEDRAQTRKNIAQVFESLGVSCLHAESAEKADELFRRDIHKLHCALIDLRLTGNTAEASKEGYELALRFRQFNKRIPLYVYSAVNISTEIKNDQRLNGCFRKGGATKESIQFNAQSILKKGNEYWDNFPASDDEISRSLPLQSKMDLDKILKITSYRTPARSQAMLRELLHKEQEYRLKPVSFDDDRDWAPDAFVEQTVKIGDNQEKEITLIVSVYKKENSGILSYKCVISSFPMIFSYGESKAEAMKKLEENVLQYYDLYSRRKERTNHLLSPPDYLRLRGLFS